MDNVRLGRIFRAVRLRRRWRQTDVARRAAVSDLTVSRIERGHLDGCSVRIVMRIAAALEIQLDWQPRWRGGDLDRTLHAGHAALHEAAVKLLTARSWVVAPEATFSIYGERGSIDILAFHARTGAVLVVELKTALVDIDGLLVAVDRYRRLAPRIAAERGWPATSVGAWVAVRDAPTNHRRLAQHVATLRAVFPDDGRRIVPWLRRPVGPVAALSFLSDRHTRSLSAASSGVARVRRA